MDRDPKAAIAAAIDSLLILSPSEKECMQAWSTALPKDQAALWRSDPLPAEAQKEFDLATADCRRESTTADAIQVYVLEGFSEAALTCVRQYLDGLSREEYAALVINAGEPAALQAYGAAVANCQAGG